VLIVSPEELWRGTECCLSASRRDINATDLLPAGSIELPSANLPIF
jgi:hypothetical protein